ncbi:MAG: WYL domain-containing protein [Chloroflexi bacterium]|nr:WYL domain-containing protein [Chloroflexota bacterium]MBV9134575.1 WYL domain-containing protein [Chloroflexota bacterium]MBV9894306.1 WYL domain-containing protein [Chloroflexota bacterium]
MNRTDRLYALVEELRARAPRPMRASELAKRFEVTTRTIERDLLALQEAGVPIWAQPGPGGGYSLNVEATLPPLNLTPAEAAAIATALAATRAMPFAEAGRTALQKLSNVMASAPKSTASKLVRQIRVAQGPNTSSPDQGVTDVIQQALIDSTAMEMTYRDFEGHETLRVVEPGGIMGTRHGWYLAAYCRLRQAPRAFRLDRIANATLTGEHFSERSLDSLLPELPFELTEPALM